MTDQKKILILRLINTLLFLIVIAFQYNSVFEIKILSANPLLPLALLVPFCMFASEINCAITGLAVGIFVDCVASTPQGFNTIFFMLMSIVVCLIAKHLFNNNIFAAFALCFIFSALYFFSRWILSMAFSLTLIENLTYLMRYALPSALYTAVLSIPLYLLQKYLFSRYYYSNQNN